MASLYRRKDSKYWFIRFKTPSGQWKDKSLGLRVDNILETRKAKFIQKKQTVLEAEIVTLKAADVSAWGQWCIPFITSRWQGRTQKLYLQRFFQLQEYFVEAGIVNPSSLTRSQVFGYPKWREAHGGCRNVALDELSLLRQLLKEAMIRNYCDRNEAVGLNIKHEERSEKAAWSDVEIAKVSAALENYSWMHVTFLFGLYQACRLQQCSIPIQGIDFARGTITYPASRVKGGKPFTHRIDPSFKEILLDLVETKRSQGSSNTCLIPEMPSFLWRKFLDTLGYRHLCHHGLRVTWITRAALAGVPETIAMRFVNHASSTVHRIYQKITIDDQSPLLNRLVLPDVSSRDIPATKP